MNKIERNRTIVVGISLLPQHLEYLDDIMNKKGLMNRSDTIRYAVAEIHSKLFPDYIYNKSASDIAKREKIVAERQLEAMEPILFAEQEIGNGIHVQAVDGQEWYIIHTWGNVLYPIKLSELKAVLPTISDIVGKHKELIEAGRTVKSIMSQYMLQLMEQEYGLKILSIIHDPSDDKAETKASSQDTEETITN